MSFADELAKTRAHASYSANLSFFTMLIVSLRHIEDRSKPTAYTNGKVIGYNPDFFLRLSKDERIFLLAHETMHVALCHVQGRGSRDPELWNMACDYYINLMLVKAGMKMVQGGLLDTKYDGMSCIEIYADLEKNNVVPPPNYAGAGDLGEDSGEPDSDELKPLSQEDKEQLERDMKAMILQAATAHEMVTGVKPGKGNACLQLLLDQLTKPKVPWKRQLRRFLVETAKNVSSYRRPNRKYLAHNMYLPSRDGGGLSKILWANDISGSVSKTEWMQSLSEIAYVLKEFKPKEVEVCEFNDSMVSNTIVRNLADFRKLPFRKGGGTDVKEVIDHYIKSDSKLLCIFTDGGLYQGHLNRPKKPVIWLIYNNPNFEASFGTVIHFNTDDLNM